MKIFPGISKRSLFTSLLIASVLMSACASNVKSTTQASGLPQATLATQATSAPKPTSKPTVAPSTPTAQATAQSITLANLPKLGDLAVIPSDAEFVREFDDPPARGGYQYLVLSLTIKNTSTSATHDFDISQLWVGQLGGELLPALVTEQFTKNLQADQIKPGQSTQGEVIFEIPDHAAEWYLQVQGDNHQELDWSLQGVG